ncbi:hypothetical protein [Escherichia coli]|uniref:hypothetical protein n=1 Tax=Escherichia coli TaxID=562 RepID=UPI0010CBA70A|nr:hypothetical protein [Escherichia coli]
MPGLVSYISSTSFANEMAEMRQQVMEGQIGGFLLGGERVRVSYMPDTGRFLAESEGLGLVYAELLNVYAELVRLRFLLSCQGDVCYEAQRKYLSV